ncbi:MAG: L,D-transpeptidase family protein [Planctomycetota bacterium]|nr:L,D-transpeptidase family protein [Planctomycetota bacterium]MDA1211222.1 L,D-transpeptidase family protein [Planctomycetota bacterium]
MRRHSRRRTVTPFSISFVVLFSATAAMAWYWKWIPWELSSTSVPQTVVDSSGDESSTFSDEFGTELTSADIESPDDGPPDIFSDQREPDVNESVSLGNNGDYKIFNRADRDRTGEDDSLRQRRNRRMAENVDDDLFADDSANGRIQQTAFEDDETPTADDDFSPLRTAKATKSRSLGLRSTNERMAEIDNLIDNSEILAAHERLSEWYFAEPDFQPDLQERIDTTAQLLFFSPQPHIEEPYVVQPGDQLRKVGKKYHVPWEFITRLNRIDPRKIRAGQKLKVFTGPFTADVDISDYRLVLKWKDLYVKSYLVGVGTKGSTPLGEFVVKDKLVDPVYYGSDGDVIANDDPNNPLGERWIDIGDSYGIHGTIEPDSIGKAMSKGCIRMLNEQVEEVYDFLDIGSTVVIHP